MFDGMGKSINALLIILIVGLGLKINSQNSQFVESDRLTEIEVSEIFQISFLNKTMVGIREEFIVKLCNKWSFLLN